MAAFRFLYAYLTVSLILQAFFEVRIKFMFTYLLICWSSAYSHMSSYDEPIQWYLNLLPIFLSPI